VNVNAVSAPIHCAWYHISDWFSRVVGTPEIGVGTVYDTLLNVNVCVVVEPPYVSVYVVTLSETVVYGLSLAP
jgi:hypothetical protein